MSQSPLQEADTVEEYSAAWGAVAWLLRKGQTWSGHERNGAFLGKGDGTFVECGGIIGLDQDGDGRSVVRVDWDGDGDLDLFLRSRTSPRIMYLENRLPLRGKSVQFKLVSSDPTKTAIGARLTLHDPSEGGAVWIRTRRAGEGYLAQSSEWMHVGVGDLSEVLVDVRWPNGETQTYGSVSTGMSHVLVQGETEPREWLRPVADSMTGSKPVIPAVDPARRIRGEDNAGRVVLAAPLPIPHIPVNTASGSTAVLGGVAESLHGPDRSAMVLLLWSPDCAPCLKELAAWSAEREKIKQADLSVLAIELESSDGGEPDSDWLERIQWPFARGSISGDTARIFAALTSQVMGSTRPLAVPTAFLVDQRGRLQVLYRGSVQPSQVVQDRSLFPLQGPARLRASFPFDGLYLDPYREPEWVQLARSFRAGDLPKVAKEYELALVRTGSLDSAESQYEFGQARLRQRNYELALKHFEEAVKAAPDVIRYLEGLAFCQYNLDKLETARVSFQAVLALDPRNAPALYNLGFLLARVKDFDAAQAKLQELRPLNSDLAGRLRKALDDMQAAEQKALEEAQQEEDSAPKPAPDLEPKSSPGENEPE